MNTLLIFGIVVVFFNIVQGAAACMPDWVGRALELLPTLFSHPVSPPLAMEIDPPCGEVTYAGHRNLADCK
jgi:hypothetical protein